MLHLNKDFTPFPVANGDEIFRNGIFHFNITKMLEYIKQNLNAIALEEVAVSNFPREFSSINESHMDSVVLSAPVILAEISPGKFNLIDGNHRMEKARRMGLEKVLAYKLNVNQHINFLTEKESYNRYIDYWNDKLKI
ncbi:MAG: ParB N-terminal domain-containing protein [Spirochaetaceae bacterium]|nr:ParB N-terminal domain-containing protein [Spirochaetaceae bacterium]